MKLEWWDVPVDISPKDPAKVKIRWDEVAGIEAITPLIRERSAQLVEMIAAPILTTTSTQAYEGLLALIPDPARRAEAEKQLAEGLQRAAGETPGATVDPIDELTRLGERRAAGDLSEEEFAAEKARLLGEI
jgi:hypothetical protein